jgi:hypothetical protein
VENHERLSGDTTLVVVFCEVSQSSFLGLDDLHLFDGNTQGLSHFAEVGDVAERRLTFRRASVCGATRCSDRPRYPNAAEQSLSRLATGGLYRMLEVDFREHFYLLGTCVNGARGKAGAIWSPASTPALLAYLFTTSQLAAMASSLSGMQRPCPVQDRSQWCLPLRRAAPRPRRTRRRQYRGRPSR